jgi:uncharacterized sporulation protein YeaH/YhbH (DUF444 family)
MSYVIDRRLNGKNKSTVNRQRFLRRYRDHIKKAVEEAVSRRSIMDMEHGEQISIPGRDIDEPVLHHGRGGKQTSCTPATRNSLQATHRAPTRRRRGWRGKAGNSGEGMDDFVFQITGRISRIHVRGPGAAQPGQAQPDRYRHLQDRARRDRQRRHPSRINIVRTLRSAHARRIALTGSSRALLREAKRNWIG